MKKQAQAGDANHLRFAGPNPRAANSMEWNVGAGQSVEGEPSRFRSHINDILDSMPYIENDSESVADTFNIDLHRYFAGAWERRNAGATAVLAIVSIFLVFAFFGISNQWQATTTLIKRSNQDGLTLAERDPFKSQNYSMETLVDTLKLPSSLEHVRQQAQLDVSLTTLAAALGVSLSNNSKILNLKVTWDNPEKSAEIANLVADRFIDGTRHLLRDDASNAFDYYSEQLRKTRDNAAHASSEVLAFRKQHGISDLDVETKVLLEEMSHLQSEYNSRVAEAGALQVARDRLLQAIADEPDQIIIYAIYRNPLETHLADYEWELSEALARYTVDNKKVQKLKERISTLNQLIDSNNDEAVPENTYGQNAKRTEMELRLERLTDDIKLREAQAGALNATLVGMTAKVAMLSSQEKDYLLVQSRLDVIHSLENELTRRVQEARLIMQRNEASFDIVERATPPSEHLPSGRKIVAFFGVFFGIFVGLFLVVFLERRDPWVRSKRDVMSILGDESCVEVPASLTTSGVAIDRTRPISEYANIYRGLSNDLDVAAGFERQLPIGIISMTPGCGRSTVATNMAITRLMKGQKVLLVDADLRQAAGRRPAENFDLITSSDGQSDHLGDGPNWSWQQDESGALTYFGAEGSRPIDDHDLIALASHNLAELLEPLGRDRFTIVDLPPLSGLEVALELAGQLGRVLIVARSGKTRRDDLKLCAARLNKRGIACVATIILDVPAERLEGSEVLSFPRLKRVFQSPDVTVET